MRLIIFLVCIVVFGVNSNPVSQNYQRFVEIPDSDGVLHLIDLENKDLPPHKFDPDTDLRYFIYNRESPSEQVEFFFGDEESLLAAQFDPSKPVKINIHGWTCHAGCPSNTVVAKAFLDVMDVNVIVIDWSVAAKTDYIRAVLYVPLVGKKVGELMDWLNTLGVSFSDFHVLGHSLGGHVAGISGRSTTRGQVEYITGQDPAFPLWGSDSQRIRPSDGKYVEIIHTNGNQLGLMEPVGHVDFYPNGGMFMTGCIGLPNRGCNHDRSYYYFADSLDHKGFMAVKCENIDEVKNKNCSNTEQLHMGGANSKPGFEGIYYLETNAEKPYYQG